MMKITISGKHPLLSLLKVAFRELCFDQQIPHDHIDLRPVDSSSDQRNSSLVPKTWFATGLKPEHCQHSPAAPHPRMAEDIHQQRIRTVAGIKFHPPPFCGRWQASSRLGMDLGQSSAPCRIGHNRFVTAWNEISMARSVVRNKANSRALAVADSVPQRLRLGIFHRPLGKFLTQNRGKVHRLTYKSTKGSIANKRRSIELKTWKLFRRNEQTAGSLQASTTGHCTLVIR